MKQITVIFIFLFIVNTLESANIYYVSSSGNASDSNNGLTELTPWRTLPYAATHATLPGSIIALKRGDTFTLTVHLNIKYGGESGNPIIWDGSLWGAGANAIVTTNGNTAALFRIVACQYVTIQNITFDGNKTNTHGVIIGLQSSMYGAPQQNNEQYITIQDCTVRNIGDKAENYHAILIETWVNDISNITIQRNTIDYVAGAGIFLYCGRSVMGAIPSEERNCYIGYNTITNYSTAGTAEGIGVNNRVTNCIFEHNKVIAGPYTVTGVTMVIGAGEYDSGAGKVGYFPTGLILRYNDFRSADYPAIYIQGCQAQEMSIYYNKLYRATGTSKNGVIRIDKDFSDLTYAGANLKFYNNTIVSESSGISCLGDASYSMGGITFRNNLMINTSSTTGGSGLLFVAAEGSTLHSNNLWWRTVPGNQIYYSSMIPSINKNRSDSTAIEPTGVFSDPYLTSLIEFDWTLMEGSHCINGGSDVNLKEDYNEYPISGLPDIGAYEYGSKSDNNIPEKTGAPEIFVFPNPVRDLLNISIKGEILEGARILNLYNLGGKLVQIIHLSSIDQDVQQIPIKLNSGLFIIQLVVNNQILATQKFLVVNL